MGHTVLARKWRPQKFADLVGQQTAITVLNNILQNKRLHHAYLLTGTRGVGKTTIARIIAKALNCTNLQVNEPCGSCNNCTDIDHGRFVDVIEIDAASNTGVDNIRELIDNAQFMPTLGLYKIYIIDEVHMLSKSAFNAMLKTLEEPPKHAVFILATTDVPKVPITILSRCLQLKLRNLQLAEITSHLEFILRQENVNYEKQALEIIAQAAHGSMRDALSITDQAIAYTNHNINLNDVKNMLGITDDTFIYNIIDAIDKASSTNLIAIANNIYNQGHDLENVLLKLNQILCDISLVQIGGINNDKLNHFATAFSVNNIQLYFEITNLGLEQIAKSNNKFQVFVMTLLRMIAFTLGNSHERQLVIQSSNFTVNPIPATEKIFTNSEHNPLTAAQVDKTEEQSVILVKPDNSIQHTLVNDIADNKISDISSNHEKNSLEFGGNWINLLETLENQLDKSIQPLLVNAQFNSFDNNQFNISIDNKYESVITNTIIENINSIFSKYFQKPITFNIQFLEKVNSTLKEKRQNEQDQKQKLAENVIASDPNIIKMQKLFSATIVPNSIKPI